MKITRRQLRKLISEAIKPGSKYDMYRRYDVTGDELGKIKALRSHEDPEYREQGLETGRTLGIPLIKQYYHQISVFTPEASTDTSIINVPIPYELIDLVVSAWNIWRKDKSKDIQFGQAINKYYDYMHSQLSGKRVHWWGEDGIHPELDQALHDGSFSV